MLVRRIGSTNQYSSARNAEGLDCLNGYGMMVARHCMKNSYLFFNAKIYLLYSEKAESL